MSGYAAGQGNIFIVTSDCRRRAAAILTDVVCPVPLLEF
jgi:hypothetical protein